MRDQKTVRRAMGRVGMVWLGCVLLAAVSADGQAAVQKGLSGGSRDRVLRFVNEKPLLGVPVGVGSGVGVCSADGLSYFGGKNGDPEAPGGAVMDLYSVAREGEVKRFQRKLPMEFGRVLGLDFFAGDSELVTLLEGDKLDERDAAGRPREVAYLLSVSDHEGDGAEVIALNLKFRPMKVGMFGVGEYLVLGWDEANRLAVLGKDGTVARFVDMGGGVSAGGAEGERAARAEVAALEGAAFVSFGREVLLTYPGTTKAMRVLGPTGQEEALPALMLPPGYVLQDVLGAGRARTVVARVREAKVAEGEKAKVRMFEFDVRTGVRLMEFVADKVPVETVTCAAGGGLTGVYRKALGSAGEDAGTGEGLVVGGMRR